MTRLRECIASRPGYFIVAIDYAGVELRIVTNLSREPKWLAEFFHCSSCDHNFNRGNGKVTPKPPPPRCPQCGSDKIGDLHTLTALEIYGQDATKKDNWKKLRGNAKATNFALCYGGGGSAVMRSTGCDKNEGWRIKKQFDGTYNVLSNWWGQQHGFAKKHGYVLTGFGRRYPVPDINHADGFFRSKAERNSVNGPVQGTSADITKIAMGLVYKECKKRGWLDKVKMIITMHDELVFEISGEVLEEAIEVIVPIMTSNPFILGMNWPIPYTTDTEIGFNWTNPWDLNAMKAGEVRFVGDKKIKGPDKVPDGYTWDDLPTFPETLAPLFKHKTFDGSPPSGGEIAAPIWERATTVGVDDDLPLPADPSQVTTLKVTGPVMGIDSPPNTEIRPAPIPTSTNGTCTYRLEAPLTISTALKLADVIRQCRGKGTKRLSLESADGQSLDGWMKVMGHPDVVVSDQEFYILAQTSGL
jgi:hypothetical protein